MKFNSSTLTPAPIPANTRVIACATVVEELRPLLPAGMICETLDFGLHVRPEDLKVRLQQAVDGVSSSIKYIVLGYGLCSQAVVGLKSARSTIIVPRADDCIGIFLGSASAYQQQHQLEPGTYYLTKGWLEAGDTPFKQHTELVERFGAEKAARITGLTLKNYTRLALIDTGQDNMDRYRQESKGYADRFNLRFEEIQGSLNLIRKMINGPWDGDFVVAPPSRAITFLDFRPE
jgi:hypothetical protein